MIKENLFKTPFFIFVDFFRWNRIKNIKIGKDELGLVCPYGIGDLYCICCMLNAFLLKNNIVSVKLIIKPSQKDIPILFPNIRKEIFLTEMPRNGFLNILKLFFKKYFNFKPGNIVIAHPNFVNRNDFKKIGKNSLNNFDVYKNMFALPEGNSEEIPIIPESAIESASRIFDKYKFRKGLTVLIAPGANSLNSFPDILWNIFIEKLITMGLDVVINDESIVHKKSVNLKLGLLEIVPFINMGGYFVSIRSGMCELVSIAKCVKVIIYPDAIQSESVILSYGMEKNVHNGQLLEVVYKNNLDLDKFVEDILEKVFLNQHK
ncbi:MAG TPA: hypothetical protein VIK86_02885 [Candidatus Paceibacterota bacterium]